VHTAALTTRNLIGVGCIAARPRGGTGGSGGSPASSFVRCCSTSRMLTACAHDVPKYAVSVESSRPCTPPTSPSELSTTPERVAPGLIWLTANTQQPYVLAKYFRRLASAAAARSRSHSCGSRLLSLCSYLCTGAQRALSRARGRTQAQVSRSRGVESKGAHTATEEGRPEEAESNQRRD